MVSVGQMVEYAVEWVTTYMGAITSNGILLAFTIVGMVGLGIGIIKRLIRI